MFNAIMFGLIIAAWVGMGLYVVAIIIEDWVRFYRREK